MITIQQAARTIKLIRITAAVLIIVSIILYFTAKQYALYTAVAGFALVALINMPLNIWLAFEREKERKAELDKYEAGRKGAKDKAGGTSDEPLRYADRKSGLRWGGGNIHAANADRKTRKKFLR